MNSTLNHYTCYYLQNAYKSGSGRDKRKTPFVGQNRRENYVLFIKEFNQSNEVCINRSIEWCYVQVGEIFNSARNKKSITNILFVIEMCPCFAFNLCVFTIYHSITNYSWWLTLILRCSLLLYASIRTYLNKWWWPPSKTIRPNFEPSVDFRIWILVYCMMVGTGRPLWCKRRASHTYLKIAWWKAQICQFNYDWG